MTRDEILAAPAGREIDEMVIRDVMKWKFIHSDDFAHVYDDGKYGARISFSPSSDISAAWEVVDKFKQEGKWMSVSTFISSLEDKWACEFMNDGAKDEFLDCVEADTAPLAICRAALLTVLK